MLKAVVDSLDDVVEELRQFYEEKNGKFYLKVGDDIKEHPSVLSLSNAHNRAKDTIKAFGDLLNGVAVDTTKIDTRYRGTVVSLQTLMEGIPEGFSKEEWERLQALDNEQDPEKKRTIEEMRAGIERAAEQKIERLKTTHAAEIKTRDDQIASLNGSIDTLTIDRGLDDALASVSIDPKFMPAVRALHRSKVKVVHDDEGPRAVVSTELDDEMPLSKYITNWVETDEGKPYVVEAKGAGANGGNQPGRKTVNNPWDPKKINRSEQSRLFKADPAKARRMAAEHGVTI